MSDQSSIPFALPALLLAWMLTTACTSDEYPMAHETVAELPAATFVRVAVFNVWELSQDKVDQVDEGGEGVHPQLRAAAEIIQRVRPDVLVLNEIDVLAERRLAADFVTRYLRVAQHQEVRPIDYEHIVYEPVNTGVPSGFDLDNDGTVGGPGDAWGFGRYPGQYGLAVLSRLPLDRGAIRSWRKLPWRALPGHLMPDGHAGRPSWYSPEVAAELRLSSKTHLDVPVVLPGGGVLHLLVSHPTPPVFDGEEDRNGRRNYDEIRLWAHILTPSARGSRSDWLVDDQGRPGGLPADESFVVAGDLNADPYADTPYGGPAIAQLLGHPRVQDPRPAGDGEPPAARVPADEYPGPAGSRTSAYGRLDYVLPSNDLTVAASGVFVPAAEDPLRRLVDGDTRASDHFLVWVDLEVP